MKRILAILLFAAMLFSLPLVTATAAENTKIEEALQTKMEETPDDEKIEVWIWTTLAGDFKSSLEMTEYADQMTRQELYETYGLEKCMEILTVDTIENVDLYRSIYNRIISDLESRNSYAVVEKLGVGDEDIVYVGYGAILMLTKEQIRQAAELDEVTSLGYDSSAGPDEPIEEPVYWLKEKLIRQYDRDIADITRFEELCCHNDPLGELDWVLVTAYSSLGGPLPIYYEIGDRIIFSNNYYAPFEFGCGIYDAKQDKFLDITKVDLSDYEGLAEQFNQTSFGRLIGDTDQDNRITIIDATIIQRCLAGVRSFDRDDTIEVYSEAYGGNIIRYYSDYDRDGVRSVLDATRIQKYLANVK